MKNSSSSLGLKNVLIFITVLVFHGCVHDGSFDQVKDFCVPDLEANATYSEVKNLYSDELVQIQDDLIIEGYVISSDEAGNFFGTLHFQDKPEDPTAGFQLDFDLRDSHLFYPIGSKIFIKLKGLYLGKQKGVFKLGGTFPSFGNLSIGRLPANVVSKHLLISCDEPVSIKPSQIHLSSLDEAMVNSLVELNDVEIIEDELGQAFANAKEETERSLIDCDDNGIILLNSGYSDFQSEMLPEGNGSVMGVLIKENNDFKIVVRGLDDFDLKAERCEDLIDEFSSNSIFISELADPNNNSGARFVELYNAGTEPLTLKGWALNRYTNDNVDVSSSIDLSDWTISGESTLVISPNASEFELVYGFAPDLGVGTNSPADSNGDDNLQLVDPFGTVIDAFGVIGDDGSGTNHEFEDGRAIRKAVILQANPTYTFGEWEIYNDTGATGTINQPQNAPEDFTPGVRN
ncbi:MAG: lamin tail domain-containing protein [Maribacter sp.]|nr:lamin tail domain-containing protein [Maribacter sp.]